MSTDIKFELSDERLTMREVFARYGHCLPVIIEVTQGHYSGDIDMDTYSTGHTMRIGSYYKQLRVVAKDAHGGYLSIPVDYPIKFRVDKPQKKGKEQTLREIVGETTLPVRIELCLPPDGYSLHIGQSIKQIESFGVLHLQQTYEETYFLANSITEKGILDPEFLFIPIYLKDLMVGIVQGMDGRTPTDFNKLRRELDDVADSLTYEGVKGNPDIAVYSHESVSKSDEKIYDHIQPSHFITYRPTRRGGKGRAGSVPHLTDLHKLKNEASPGVQHNHHYSSLDRSPEHVASFDPDRLTTEWRGSGRFGMRRIDPVAEQESGGSGRFEFGNPQPIAEPGSRNPQTIAELGSRNPKPIAEPETAGVAGFVKGYTIRQVVESLRELRLEKYTEVIEQEQVSGDILLELDIDCLKSDLGMRSVEAVKLRKFAWTGYVPR